VLEKSGKLILFLPEDALFLFVWFFEIQKENKIEKIMIEYCNQIVKGYEVEK